jgi:hypothetical protein
VNVVTVARLARLKQEADKKAGISVRNHKDYQRGKDKGLVRTFIWIHPEDRKSLRDYASWLIQRRKL